MQEEPNPIPIPEVGTVASASTSGICGLNDATVLAPLSEKALHSRVSRRVRRRAGVGRDLEKEAAERVANTPGGLATMLASQNVLKSVDAYGRANNGYTPDQCGVINACCSAMAFLLKCDAYARQAGFKQDRNRKPKIPLPGLEWDPGIEGTEKKAAEVWLSMYDREGRREILQMASDLFAACTM